MTSVSPEMLTIARESRGYSQTELARRLQVTQGYISKLEAGVIDDVNRTVSYRASPMRSTIPSSFFGSICRSAVHRVSITGSVRRYVSPI